MVLVTLRVFNLKRFTVGAFAVPFSLKKYDRRYLLKDKKFQETGNSQASFQNFRRTPPSFLHWSPAHRSLQTTREPK